IMISEKATSEIRKNTIATLDWKKFNVVQLKNENNAIHVSGKFKYGFYSGYTNGDFSVLKEKPLTSVDEMTEMLLAFFAGKNTWVDKHKNK
ncbi:hypothetical protein, partial [Aquimarina sp. BL5]|uniref:hypothetical protein n=1 Tax=Aquimarina sp. BL5 TaxID=1714860 RepID=UPI001314B1D1